MIDKNLLRCGKSEIEMNIVCTDYSLLENINGYLRKSGIIGIRDGEGTLHYIIDGRNDRLHATDTVSSIVTGTNRRGDHNEDYYDACAKSIFREYNLDLKHIGAVIIYDSIKKIIYEGTEIPTNMKRVYVEAAKRYSMSFCQIERDVRYSLKRSALAEVGSRNAMRTLVIGVRRRISSGGEK